MNSFYEASTFLTFCVLIFFLPLIVQLLDAVLGKRHGSLFRRSELMTLVDFHGDEVMRLLSFLKELGKFTSNFYYYRQEAIGIGVVKLVLFGVDHCHCDHEYGERACLQFSFAMCFQYRSYALQHQGLQIFYVFEVHFRDISEVH